MTVHNFGANTDGASPWEEFQQSVQTDLDEARRNLQEVTLMYEQSQAELAKLTQRNAAITAHLQQVRSQVEATSKADIQNAYNAALEAQQRLLVMRGQIEKLQNDQETLKRYVTSLERAHKFLSEGHQPPRSMRAKGGGSAVLELVINAQEQERQRLSRQMHDGPAQALSNFIVQADIVARFFEVDLNRSKEELNALKTTAMSTFQKVRFFISELRPMMLDDLGVVPTIRRYADTLKEQSGADISLNVKGNERRFEPYIEVMIFRSMQELIGGAVRHNQELPYKLQINAQMVIEDRLVRVSVSDNGKGMRPEDESESGVGIKLIRERVEMVGGYMEIDSNVGQGSRITFQIPVEPNAPEPEQELRAM